MHPSGSPRVRRPASLAALAVVGVLTLSGCFKLDMELELASDDTVDGSIIIAVDRDQAELFGGEDALREAIQGQEGALLEDQPETGTVETRDYEDEDWIGTETVFTDVALDEFSGAETGELSITREGDEFVVAGTLDLSGEVGADPTSGAAFEGAEAEISITFPGEVISSNGEEDGNTVTWEPVMGESLELQARGSAEAGLPWTLIAAIAALVALVGVGIVLLVVVRGRQQPATADGPLPESSIVPGGAPAMDAEAAAEAPTADTTPADPATADSDDVPPAAT
jgi:hypothetical protein